MDTTTAPPAADQFGAAMRAARTEADLSIEESCYRLRDIAPAANRISRGTLGRIEQGAINPADLDAGLVGYLVYGVYGKTLADVSPYHDEVLRAEVDMLLREAGWISGMLIDAA